MATVATPQATARGLRPQWVVILMVGAAAMGAGVVALFQSITAGTEAVERTARASFSVERVEQSRALNRPATSGTIGESRFSPKAVLDSKALNEPTYPQRWAPNLKEIGDGRALNSFFFREERRIRDGRTLNRPDR